MAGVVSVSSDEFGADATRATMKVYLFLAKTRFFTLNRRKFALFSQEHSLSTLAMGSSIGQYIPPPLPRNRFFGRGAELLNAFPAGHPTRFWDKITGTFSIGRGGFRALKGVKRKTLQEGKKRGGSLYIIACATLTMAIQCLYSRERPFVTRF